MARRQQAADRAIRLRLAERTFTPLKSTFRGQRKHWTAQTYSRFDSVLCNCGPSRNDQSSWKQPPAPRVSAASCRELS